MNEVLHRLSERARQVAQERPDVQASQAQERARLHIANAVQRALEELLGSDSIGAIIESGLAREVDMSPEAIHAVSRADRHYPVSPKELGRLADALKIRAKITPPLPERS